MRVYIGERDPATGHPHVRVVHEPPSILEITDLLGDLRDLAERHHNLDRGPRFDEHRAAVLARKQELIAEIEAAERSHPDELVHHPEHSWDERFDWGDVTAGAADLARSILTREIGEPATPVVSMAFVADVVSAFDRDSFRLAAEGVWDWIEDHRDLVQHELFDMLPPPDRDPSWPALAIADPSTPVGNRTVELSDATGSAVVRACEQAWADIQAHHPELPNVVIVLGTGVERGRLIKLGHWWDGRWTADGQIRGEVLLAGEALHLPPAEVFEVLLHEAAHGLNAARRIPDTSRGGRYHNRRFAITAEEVLLRAELLPPYGYAATKLTPDAKERYEPTIERLGDAMRIARNLGGVKVGVEGELETGHDGAGDRDGRRKDNTITARCGCGRQFRMAPSVYRQAPVLCGNCDSAFRDVAEQQAEPEPDTSIVDNTFVGRRQAALNAEEDPTRAAPPERLVALLDEERARLHAAIAAASGRETPRLQPLHGRLAMLDQLLDSSGAPSSAAPEPPSEWQLDGLAKLLDGRAPPDDTVVARWYRNFGTLDEQPMPPGDDPPARAQVARALLEADGTLTGPRVPFGDNDLLVGDRVIATRDVPEHGLAVGVPGTVEHIDGDHGDVRIDFATWGRLELSVAELLDAGIAHDYTAPEASAGVEPHDLAEQLLIEANRIEPGAGW